MLETPACEVGRPLAVSLMLRSDNGLPIPDATVKFTVDLPSGEKFEARAANDPGNPGWFRLSFMPDQSGSHTVHCECMFDDGTELKDNVELYVAPSREKLLKVRCDAAALEALAKATGGTTADVTAHEKLQLPETPMRAASFDHTVSLWRSPGLMIVLVARLAAEWFVRKRRGLS